MKTILLTVFLIGASCVPLVALSRKSQDFLRLLFAEGPAPEHRNQLMLFGQLVGAWEFDGVEYKGDGNRATDKGEIHFAWVLQGRAVQDLWIEHEISYNRPKVYGTTLRFYDPSIDAWRVTWTEPGYGVVTNLIGRKIGEEIVMEGRDNDGKAIRWIFSRIKPDSFHWRGERLVGDTWQVYEELSARRKR